LAQLLSNNCTYSPALGNDMQIIFEQRHCQHGDRIGIATLNAPSSLNAMTLPMINALTQQLDAWANDPTITCVVLRGNGEKAFCAGGDIRQLALQCREQPGQIPALAWQFFADEYRLDHRLHTYTKPLICWGHGYVMGGGMGMLQGASVRIVTPTSRLAMPEISIGLYPDAGGSWFLSRLPGKMGLFFGLTGAQLNASDAIELNLADRFLLDEQQDALLDGLQQLNWREQPQLQLNSLLKALAQQAQTQLPTAQWQARRRQIDALLDVSDLPSAWQAISGLQNDQDQLLASAARSMSSGCPLTAYLVWEQIHRAKHLSLAQVFQMEYSISLNCCRHPEFAEGVRARLLDKDQTPHWHWPDVHAISPAEIAAHFQPPWDGEHPLADLN
jgi:enoyl-CoA hydratase/carnithine racemase